MAKEAKRTKMSEEAQAEREALKANRTYLLSPDDFDAQDGQEFGGESGLLILDEGECAGPFTYSGHSQIQTELGETTSHTALTPEGDQVRLPIQATFLRAVDQARLGFGDTFAVKRCDDAIKKKGKGAGQAMAIYALKVITRGVQEAKEG